MTSVHSLMLGNVGSGLEFTEASEFARSIQLREPEEDAQRPADSADHMGVNAASAPAGAASTSEQVSPSVPPKRRAKSKYEPTHVCVVVWGSQRALHGIHVQQRAKVDNVCANVFGVVCMSQSIALQSQTAM